MQSAIKGPKVMDNEGKLSENEILILRDTVETAGAVANLAAARLFPLLTCDDDEPGVNLFWHYRDGQVPVDGDISRMTSYVISRQPCGGEQLYRHEGGRNWRGESEAFRQSLQLFCQVILSVATAMDERKARIAAAEIQSEAARHHQPLKLEDSIFEPEEGLGVLMPHAVSALQAGATAARQLPTGEKAQKQMTDMAKPMSVGEAPVGLEKQKAARKRGKSKKAN